MRAGADVIETNTFGANRVKLAPFGLGDRVKAINAQGAKIARFGDNMRGVAVTGGHPGIGDGEAGLMVVGVGRQPRFLKPYEAEHVLSRIQFVLVNGEMRRHDQPGTGVDLLMGVGGTPEGVILGMKEKVWMKPGYEYSIEIGAGIFIIAGILSVTIALLTISFQALKAAPMAI